MTADELTHQLTLLWTKRLEELGVTRAEDLALELATEIVDATGCCEFPDYAPQLYSKILS